MNLLDLDRLDMGDSSGPWAMLDADGDLLAVYEHHKGASKPAVVIPR
mgnify:FL=1